MNTLPAASILLPTLPTRRAACLAKWLLPWLALALWGPSPAAAAAEADMPGATLAALAADVRTGDLVFTRIDVLPFREVAAATGTWTNHVGIVVGRDGGMPVVAESTFPWSRQTPLAAFIARSEAGRVAVLRLPGAWDAAAEGRLHAATQRRLGVLYDTGFNLDSPRQFCSRFVREVVLEARGQPLGQVQTLTELFAQHPQARLGFWRAWYLGQIPWQRRTVTPASLLQDPTLQTVFDGHLVANTVSAAREREPQPR